MSPDLLILCTTAASIGFFHTIIGVDHYLPFIALSKSRDWSMKKTMLITASCGFAHVITTILLGLGIIYLASLTFSEETIQALRGDITAYLLVTVGLIYTAWGIKKAINGKEHSHPHIHKTGESHKHEHIHEKEHLHAHKAKSKELSIWAMFIIFAFGPCEALIPVIMAPAAKGDGLTGVFIVSTIFTITTVATMCIAVLIASYGLKQIKLNFLSKYSHAVAGSIIALSGLAIILGL